MTHIQSNSFDRQGYFHGHIATRLRSRLLPGLAAFGLSVGAAQAQCLIIDDPALYEDRKQQAIILMQYGETVVRATGGKIRCAEDAGGSRQICTIDGPGEMLIDAQEADLVVQLKGAGEHVVHLSSKGTATCVP